MCILRQKGPFCWRINQRRDYIVLSAVRPHISGQAHKSCVAKFSQMVTKRVNYLEKFCFSYWQCLISSYVLTIKQSILYWYCNEKIYVDKAEVSVGSSQGFYELRNIRKYTRAIIGNQWSSSAFVWLHKPGGKHTVVNTCEVFIWYILSHWLYISNMHQPRQQNMIAWRMNRQESQVGNLSILAIFCTQTPWRWCCISSLQFRSTPCSAGKMISHNQFHFKIKQKLIQIFI